MLFVNYPKCSTCRKAKNWLDEHNIEYESRHIIDDNLLEFDIAKTIDGYEVKSLDVKQGMKPLKIFLTYW